MKVMKQKKSNTYLGRVDRYIQNNLAVFYSLDEAKIKLVIKNS